MSGGIMQLVAIGEQDTHLSKDPSFSFFKSAFRRHTNFSQVVESQLILLKFSLQNLSQLTQWLKMYQKVQTGRMVVTV